MKRIVFLLVCILCISGAKAQHVGKLSFIPRVGLNLSNLGDMDIYTGFEGGKMVPKYRADVVAGAEAEYSVHDAVSVSLGAYYSRQGCHYRNHMDKTIMNDDPNQLHYEGLDNQNVKLQYLNIPLLAKLHISDMVSLKTGLQCGVFLAGHWTWDLNVTETINNEVQKSQTTHCDDDLEWGCSKTVWSIPVGFEIEYQRANISVSYAIPLNSFAKEVTGIGGHYHLSKGRNKVLSFTVGYRL